MSEGILQGKCILLGVTGSIAAYKSAMLASLLVKQGADVHVVMTKNATRFIAPLTFSSLTGNRCISDMFDDNFEYEIGHISLAKRIDLAIIAPASANVMAKLANGIADDMLTTTLLATRAPVILAPAMNTNMYQNPVTQDNIRRLISYGHKVITPASGRLACGDEGAGKMPEPSVLLDHILLAIGREKTLSGKKVLISAGPTREPIDPVRFITNHSTGKMGRALAFQAALMGAEVTLVCGPTGFEPLIGVDQVDTNTAGEMYDEIMKRAGDSDIIIMSAAVADYTPAETATEKIKKKDSDSEGMAIELKRTKDILATLGSERRQGQFICGFSMETENVIANSRAKLTKKNADMIVANDLRTEGAGFGTDTNVVTLITADNAETLPLLSKDETAWRILSSIVERS